MHITSSFDAGKTRRNHLTPKLSYVSNLADMRVYKACNTGVCQGSTECIRRFTCGPVSSPEYELCASNGNGPYY